MVTWQNTTPVATMTAAEACRGVMMEAGISGRGGQMGAEPGTAGLPPGYPQECEQEVTLRDGRRVLIRPILPSDAPELGEAIKTADPGTLHRRFLGAPPRVTPALLAHLTVVDYVRRFALVAIDTVTGRGVAVARYEPAGEGVADIAVAVRPACRRAGQAGHQAGDRRVLTRACPPAPRQTSRRRRCGARIGRTFRDVRRHDRKQGAGLR
jgi:hypothetical protein